MTNLEEREATGAKRLVLGFDAGCSTCNNLARRIKEQVGDKLEIRSLRDPQVKEWRNEAFGGDASWVPTLIEVKDSEVRAWAGWRMGWALSRVLGPTATWRVAQALGEVRGAPKVATVTAGAFAGLSRGYFLKGVGGVALTIAILADTRKIASASEAATDPTVSKGTRAQQQLTERIVRTSREFKQLVNGYGSAFDWDRAIVKVAKDGDFASLTVASKAVGAKGPRFAVVALFLVGLDEETIISYRYVTFEPVDDDKGSSGAGAVEVTLYSEGQEIDR